MAEKEVVGEEESDLDDAPLPAVRRRAAASDDDEEDERGGGGTGSPTPSRVVGSDSYFDGQGAAEMYDDDDEVYDEEGSEVCEEVYEKFEAGGGGVGVGETKAVVDEVVAAPEDEGKYEEVEEAEVEAAVEGEGKVKEGSEPYTVPTAGAFYMHDDRFEDQEIGSHGSQRDFFGGQKLWYPKDDSIWVHDRFDEMNFHDVQHDHVVHARRKPRKTLRAWGGRTTHGVDHGYFDGTKSRSYYHDDSEDYEYVPKESHTRHDSTKNYNGFPKESNTSYDNAKNYRSVPTKFNSYYDDTKNFDNVQRESYTYYGNAKGYNNAPNVYRDRASRPCQPHCKNTFEISSVQNNSETYSRSQNEEASYYADMGKHCSQTLSFQHEQTLPWKRTFAPNLNSTSPTFYPSRSSCQEPPFIQRGKACPGIFTKLFTSSVRMAHSSLKPQSCPILAVKAFAPSGGHGNAVHSLRTVSIEGMPGPSSHSSVPTSNNYSHYSKSRDQGKGLYIGDPTKNKFSSSTSQATRSYTQSHNAVYQQMSVQQPVQPTPKTSTPIFCQKFSSTNKIQSHPQTIPTSLTEDAETSTPRGSNNSVVSSAEGQNDEEETESASFPYGGDHVLDVTGARGLTIGDQDFTDTRALLPVMQFSGQHPKGPGISSIGTTLPGFVAPQQLSSNSEMSQITWLPILTGATGALGATYSPPYFGTYYPQPSEFASSSVSPRDNTTIVPISLNSQEVQEIVGHELGQRKNKPRRYSEMNFAS